MTFRIKWAKKGDKSCMWKDNSTLIIMKLIYKNVTDLLICCKYYKLKLRSQAKLFISSLDIQFKLL